MKLKYEEILNFGDVLYEAQCPICGEKLEWEADFDADGTNYCAKCCEKIFYMIPYKVKICIEKSRERDE